LTDNQAYKLAFNAIGQDVIIWPLAKVVNPEVISIGDSVIIDDFVFLAGGAKTILSSFNHIAAHASIVGGGEFILEDFAGVSGGVRIYTGNDDYLGGSLTGPTVPSPFRIPIRSFVHVGKHAVIGANSVILPGVTIGEGVAVGANSFVSKDCKPWTIYAGTPARPLKERPSEKILEMENQLRRQLYDGLGNYIPKSRRA
jgi:galactoside O-acetyltransferase